jgi:SEC-C motif-containing protein
VSINDRCPCGSGLKYKKCCKTYHDGKVPKSALLLMKSRYSAYALNQYKYIIKTHYKSTETIESIKEFSENTTFEKLEILEFLDGENEAFVTFRANLFTNNNDSSFTEKSRFIKENEKWFYIDGEMI